MRREISTRTAKRHWLETISHSSEESLVTIAENWEGRTPSDPWVAWQLKAINAELDSRPERN